MRIKYDGTRENILEIMENLPVENRWVVVESDSIIIMTSNGERKVSKGDTVKIGNEKVDIEKDHIVIS